MSLILTAEEESLRDSVRRFVAERSPMPAVREVVEAGQAYDPAIWKQLSAQLGLASLLVPEEYDGSGAGCSALAVALQELGAGLVPSPLLASGVLAAGALLALEDEEARRDLLPGIASGEIIATLALTGAASWVTAEGSGDDVTLTGEIGPVLNGAQAGVLLIPAAGAETVAIYRVDHGAEGLTREPLTSLDHTRALARLGLDHVPARPVTGDAGAAIRAAGDLANLALAAEQVGAMAACLVMTSEYARLRVAFGQPIGAFQAVKHALADIETAWELARAALRDAARAGDHEPDRFGAAASVARVLTSGPYFSAAAATIQLHGGIGFTWEHDAHLYYKNAMSGRVLLGGPAEQLDRLAATLEI